MLSHWGGQKEEIPWDNRIYHHLNNPWNLELVKTRMF